MAEPNLSAWKGVVAYLEAEGGRLSSLSLEMAALAQELGRSSGQEALGFMAAPENIEPEILKGLPLSRIIFYQSSEFNNFKTHVQAGAMVDALESLRPSAVLVGASDQGKDVAPLVAAHFKTGLTADCTKLEIRPDGNLLQTRPAFGGNVMAEILTPTTRPQFATVRSGVIKAGDQTMIAIEPEIIHGRLPNDINVDGLSVLKTEHIEPRPSIAEARLLIAVGCGIKSVSDLALIGALAKKMGGQLASSRCLVEKGWMPAETQIGLSGLSVAPDVLLTLGVSGSVQFLAGIGGAGYIIAVNNNPEARIFSVAHHGICADLYEILPVLSEKQQLI